MWDARIYSASALGLIHYLTTDERFGHPELDTPADSAISQQRFKVTIDEYLNGEPIRWLQYSIPTVARAEHYLFISGPVLPTYLAAIFYFDTGNDFAVVRTINTVLDALCMLLLMLIAARLLGNRVAILAGIFYLIYLPFILMTGMISSEQITVLLILLTLHVILLWYDNNKSAYMYIAGLSLGLLVLTKPTAVLLFVPFAVGFIYDNRNEIRKLLSPLIKAAVPFLLMTVPWFIVASMYFGRPAIRDPEYAVSNLRSSSSVEYEGYDLDYVKPDFWLRSTSQMILDNPLGYARLLLKKFDRLWAQPYNDMDQSFVINQTISRVIHFVIVLSALFGVLFVFIDFRPGMIYLFVIPLYYTLVHIVFHSLARYNLNAMPIMMIAAAMVLIKVYDYVRGILKSDVVGKIVVRVVLFVLGGGFILFFPDWIMISLIGVSAAILIIVVLKTAVFLIMSYYLFKILSIKIGRDNSLRLISFPVLLLTLMIVVPGSATDSWAEWDCRLADRSQAAGVRIYFPDNFKFKADNVCRVAIDMVATHDFDEPFLLTTNGLTAPFYFDREPVSEFYYHKATFDIFQAVYNMKMQEMRNWRSIPLNIETVNQLLARNGYLDFRIQASNVSPDPKLYIDIFGFYPSEAAGEVYIPSFSYYATSIERFVEKGDPRIWMKYPLSSDSVISYYIDGKTKRRSPEDLSPSIGKQYGRFGIFLEVKEPNETVYHY